jgi:hypothetical protein
MNQRDFEQTFFQGGANEKIDALMVRKQQG